MTFPRPRRVAALCAGSVSLALVAAGCSGTPTPQPTAQELVPESALNGLLLNGNDIDAIMDGAPLIAEPVTSAMDDNRNMLPNLNCLGVWHPGETAIYGTADTPGSWTSVRRQLLRAPGNDQWRSSVVQSVTSYPTPEGARDFLSQSADRWTKCSNHTVNITLNDQRLPRWRSGDLDAAPDRLRMPIGRSTETASSSCEHVLSARVNVVIDVLACTPRSADMRQASVISERIASHVPTSG
ncbi:MAG: sensor domain-containing protein [Mycobacterium kyogaense]|uniref:sensor domain-containing protein n=1 Tax=Mycobacterium kyogaense TaxID=2212479 RepID=UPI002FF598E4